MKIEISKKQLSQILIDLDNIRYMLRYIDINNELAFKKRLTEDFNYIKDLITKLEKEI